MVEATLLVSSSVASVASGIFLSVALRLRERAVSKEAQPAIALFATWWMALAVYAVVGASMDLVAAVGMAPIGIFTALAYMQLVAICIGLWGLMYYLAYVLTGSRSLMLPLAVFYSLYYALILFVVTLQRPIEVTVAPWRAALAYDSTLVAPLATVLLTLPLLAFVSAWAVDWAFDPPRFVKRRLVAGEDVDPMASAT